MLEDNDSLSRARLLLGDDRMERLGRLRVILFGTGGVGSWCAETLVRTGVRHITLVDPDMVAASNINRQLPATALTVGRPKVEVMAEHLREIAPDGHIVALCHRYTAESAADFRLGDYDCVVDCIDSVADKAHLLLHATSLKGLRVYSSMGAARKLHPERMQVADFMNVRGCPLAAALRARFKRLGQWPRRRVTCVYSDEVLPAPSSGGPNGSLMQVTAVWGITLASRIIIAASSN